MQTSSTHAWVDCLLYIVMATAVQVWPSVPGLFKPLCDAANFDKIWYAGGQNEIQYKEWRMNK